MEGTPTQYESKESCTTATTTTATTASNTTIDNDCPRFRPFATLPTMKLKVRKAKYSTSLDPRGYIPVYEYIINNQPIMWDRETGYVHFTGIWKALGNSKSDIVKMVDSNPELKVKKIRGGFLKIQGTWIPYEFAAILCRRTSWYIRKELTAIFGPRFSNEALDPSHAEYGCLLLNPKNASTARGTNSRRGSGYTTMRQVRQQQHHHPYLNNKVAAAATNHSRSLNLGSGADGVSSMSLSRLLNTDMSSYPLLDESSSSSPISDYDEDDTASRNGAGGLFTESPHTTPSPTFRGAASFPWPPSSSQKESFSPTSFAPMTSSYSCDAKDYVSVCSSSSSTGSCPVPRITPVQWNDLKTPPLSSPPSNSNGTQPSIAALNQDIIDTISATILLQRLSQDDGKRPFRPMSGHTIPSRVVVGDQEYRIQWDN